MHQSTFLSSATPRIGKYYQDLLGIAWITKKLLDVLAAWIRNACGSYVHRLSETSNLRSCVFTRMIGSCLNNWHGVFVPLGQATLIRGYQKPHMPLLWLTIGADNDVRYNDLRWSMAGDQTGREQSARAPMYIYRYQRLESLARCFLWENARLSGSENAGVCILLFIQSIIAAPCRIKGVCMSSLASKLWFWWGVRAKLCYSFNESSGGVYYCTLY